MLVLGSWRHSITVICFNKRDGCEVTNICVSTLDATRGCALYAFYRLLSLPSQQERLVDLQQEVLSALFTEYLLFCGMMGKWRPMVVGNLSQMNVNWNAWALRPLLGTWGIYFRSFLPLSHILDISDVETGAFLYLAHTSTATRTLSQRETQTLETWMGNAHFLSMGTESEWDGCLNTSIELVTSGVSMFIPVVIPPLKYFGLPHDERQLLIIAHFDLAQLPTLFTRFGCAGLLDICLRKIKGALWA